ncbi:hypothetical protein V1478_012422 [Vespula squamosa]|uniref:Uncharacterized protein n=1 Tax=Vespula squamosa TaxID=30214 RepID=A0ABD2AD75_VESSQ
MGNPNMATMPNFCRRGLPVRKILLLAGSLLTDRAEITDFVRSMLPLYFPIDVGRPANEEISRKMKEVVAWKGRIMDFWQVLWIDEELGSFLQTRSFQRKSDFEKVHDDEIRIVSRAIR